MTLAPSAVGWRLLLIDDDRALVAQLCDFLAKAGYVVEHAADGERGRELLATGSHDIAVLERGVPIVDGLSVLMAARRRGSRTPVLMLSTLGDVRDRVDGLNCGAEDYLVKPFDFRELLARLQALQRRSPRIEEALRLGSRVLDTAARTVSGGAQGEPVLLSERETALLAVLAARPGRVFTRGELRDRVFHEAGSDTIVDTYVHYCRRKLGSDAIRTVRSIGYRIGTA